MQENYLKKNKTNCAGKLSEKIDRRSAKRRNAKVEYKVEYNQDRESENALKHARWPAATCGSKLPTAKFRTWPGGRGIHARKISFVGGVCDFLQRFCGQGAGRHDF